MCAIVTLLLQATYLLAYLQHLLCFWEKKQLFLFLNASVKSEPILISFGMQNSECILIRPEKRHCTTLGNAELVQLRGLAESGRQFAYSVINIVITLFVCHYRVYQ